MKLLSRIINNTFIRFAFIGVINTAFGVGLYCLFIYFGITYGAAVLLSTILGVLFNFKTIGTFVFKNNNNRLIYKFIASYVIVYFFNIGLIHVFLNCQQLNEYTAGIIATPIVAIFSFLLQKYFVFKERKEDVA